MITITDNSRRWCLSESELSGRKYLRVPIALKGKWEHQTYGTVEFNQQDFNDIIANWSSAKAGYDPPLYIGHPINTDTVEGAPAAGWPDQIYQEGDVLYGLFTPTSEELFTDVQQQRYRYASAEVIREAKDKETGDRIGTLLVGTALTNRPFLPLREHTVEAVEQKFSDYVSPTLFSFNLDLESESINMSDTTNTTELKAAGVENDSNSAPAEQKLSTPEVAAATSAVENTVPRQQYDALAEEFSKLAKEFSVMKQQFSEVLDKEKERGVNEKLSKLEALNLPASTKQTFSDMIRGGSLTAEAEEKLFSDYQQLSENYKHVFSTPQGVQEDAAKEEKEVRVPQIYADIIARNEEILKTRSAGQMPRVFN